MSVRFLVKVIRGQYNFEVLGVECCLNMGASYIWTYQCGKCGLGLKTKLARDKHMVSCGNWPELKNS